MKNYFFKTRGLHTHFGVGHVLAITAQKRQLLGNLKSYHVQILIKVRRYIDLLRTKISNELLKKKLKNFEF